MPNRLESVLNKNGEFILGLIFFLIGYTGIAIYISRYVDNIIGLRGLNISVPHSPAFLAIMAVLIFIGLVLMVDDISKTF